MYRGTNVCRGDRIGRPAGMAADDRGESEVLGTLLMAVLIAAAVALFASLAVLPLVSDDLGRPVAGATVTVTLESVVVDHDGGDTMQRDDLLLILRPDGREEVRVGFDAAANAAAIGETFSEGERATFDVAPPYAEGQVVEVLVVHRPSNELVFSGRKIASLSSAEQARRLSWQGAGEWPRGDADRVVYDGFGTRRVDRLQLGYAGVPGPAGSPDEGLVGYYPFEEESGVNAFDTTRTNDGTVKDDSVAGGAYALGVPGVTGSTAYAFDPQGSGQFYGGREVEKGAYVDLGTDTSAALAGTSVTWSAWVTVPPEAGDKDTVVAANFRDRTNNVLLFVCKTNGCTVGDTSTTKEARLTVHTGEFHRAPGGPRLNDGQWHHVAMTIDADSHTFTLYTDGVEVHRFTDGRLVNSDDLISIGQDSDDSDYGFGTGTSDFFDGSMDDVRLYSRALSPIEIARLARLDGSYTSAPKRYEDPVAVTTNADAASPSLALADVLATVPSGPTAASTATVYVEADLNGDGDFDDAGERSDAISVDGSAGTYGVTFSNATPGQTAHTFRLHVELSSAVPTDPDEPIPGPTLSRVDLRRTD